MPDREELVVLSIRLKLPKGSGDEDIQLLLETKHTKEEWNDDSELRSETIQELIQELITVTIHPTKGEMH